MHVLITGGSNGIGRATALEFAKNRHHVALTYLDDEENAILTARKCLELGAKAAMIVPLDVRNDASIKAALAKVLQKFNTVGTLINNAGVAVWKPLKDQTAEEVENQLRTNLEGLIKMTKACLPHAKSIVNVSSGAGKTGYADLSIYCATKFGIRGFTQALAEEHPDLNIVCVNPGMTATRMTGFTGIPPETVAKIIYEASLGKHGQDVDVWKVTG